MRAAPLLASLIALAGCATVTIPDGCYRTTAGEPLFRVTGGTGDFIGKASPLRFMARIETDHTVSITPHFYLHDSAGGAGPDWVPKLTEPRRAGSMQYREDNGILVIRVPVEGWGELDVSPGKAC